jgi:hypothetical protein
LGHGTSNAREKHRRFCSRIFKVPEKREQNQQPFAFGFSESSKSASKTDGVLLALFQSPQKAQAAWEPRITLSISHRVPGR